jgi:germination protein M
MNQRVVWIVASGVVAAALLGWLLFSSGRSAGMGDLTPAHDQPTPTPAPEQRVMLLFPGNDGLLHPELRSVPLPAEVHERLRVVVHELLAGSKEGLFPVLPYRAELLTAFVDKDGQAFIDLTPPPAPLAGSHTELLLAYGLVDTVLLNCPELHAVQILFDDNEVATLTGHLDLSKPLVLNKRFIAAR